jgi:hypothetical protein
MARSAVKNAVAVRGDTQGLDLLGRLVSYTFPDDPIPANKVLRSWAKHGLDVNDLPDVRSSTHLFQSACKSVEVRRRANGHSIEIKVDEVLNNAQECVYQVTRLVRDRAEKVIEHPKAMTLRLNKALDTIEVRELEDYAAHRPLEEAIREHFQKHAKDLTGQKIRNSVRDVLLGIGAQNLRRKAGGLYFVPDAYKLPDGGVVDTLPILDGLAGFLEDMHGDRADFYRIPLLSDDAAEEMVAKHFAINANEQAQELVEKAVNRLRQGKGRGVRADLMANLYNERRKLLGMVDQYDKLVTLERDEIDRNIADLDKQMQELEALQEGGD